MRSRDKHRGLRNPLEAERFQVCVEGERRVDAFPSHQNLGRAIRVRNARRSVSPECRVGLPLDLLGDMQHSQGRRLPGQAEVRHSDAPTRLVEEKRDGLVDHVVRRVKETERVAGFRDSLKDADCGCVISIVLQGPGDECPGVQEQLHRLRRRQRTSSTFEASVRLPVENVLDKSKSGSQDKSPSRDAHSERACRAASFKVSPLASAVRKTNAYTTGSTSVWMTFFPRIGKESGHGLFTCSHYMYLRDGILAPNDTNSSRRVRSSHLGILAIFVRGRLEDPAECAGSPKRDELRINEIV